MQYEELFSLQNQFQFSSSKCSRAQHAAEHSCQCSRVNTPVNERLPQEDSGYRCDPIPIARRPAVSGPASSVPASKNMCVLPSPLKRHQARTFHGGRIKLKTRTGANNAPNFLCTANGSSGSDDSACCSEKCATFGGVYVWN
jgi:hypothetical protein